MGLQCVGQPVDQRRFGADHHQRNGVFAAEGHNSVMVFFIEVYVFGNRRRATIARCTKQSRAVWAAGNFPAQGVFAPAAAQNKYVEFGFCHMIAAIRWCFRPVKSSIITRVTKAKAHGRV